MTTIVITGIGVVLPLGIGFSNIAPELTKETIAIDALTRFDPPADFEHAAEVSDQYNWEDYLFSKQTIADPVTQFALGAARLALEHAGLTLPLQPDAATGLVFATEHGCLQINHTFYQPLLQGRGKSASGLVFSHSYPNAPASLVAIELGLGGYSTIWHGDKSSGFAALQDAYLALISGQATQIVVGAADAISEPLYHDYKGITTLLTTDTSELQIPQDIRETRQKPWCDVPGEGAIFFVLETLSSAYMRKANIYYTIESFADQLVTDCPTKIAEDFRCGNLAAVAPFFDRLIYILNK